MSDKITAYTTRLGVRYGVHVGNLTKGEARGMLASAATLQNDRHGYIERDDMINEVERPTVLDPSPASDHWLSALALFLGLFPIACWLGRDAIIDIIKAVH